MKTRIPTYIWVLLVGSFLLGIWFLVTLLLTEVYTEFLNSNNVISLMFWSLVIWSFGNLIIMPIVVLYRYNVGRIQYGMYLFLSIFFILYVIKKSSYVELFFLLFIGSGTMFLVLLLSDVSSFFLKKRPSNRRNDEPIRYSYKEYSLFYKDIMLKGSKRTQRIYFFSKRLPKDGIPCDIPTDYITKVNKRTQMPYLKKKKT